MLVVSAIAQTWLLPSHFSHKVKNVGGKIAFVRLVVIFCMTLELCIEHCPSTIRYWDSNSIPHQPI